MKQCGLILSVILFGLLNLAEAQTAKFRAGVINVTEVQSQPDGSARHIYEVRQQLEGEAPTVLLVNAGKPYNLVEDEIPAKAEQTLDLTGEIYSNKKYNSIGSSSKNSLTPATVQDQSLGCRRVSLGIQDRIDSIANKSTSNVDFSISSSFHVVDNSKRASVCSSGSCQVHNQIFPAPNYQGPLFFDAPIDQFSRIDLKPHIKDASGNFSCALHSAKDQNGIRNTGLQTNPPGVAITSDCLLEINTAGFQLGEKYAFRVVITSGRADPSCGKAATELDLLVQGSCKEGDLACLQCAPLDVNKIFGDIDAAYSAMTQAWKGALGTQAKVNKLIEKKAGKENFLERNRIRRSQKKFETRSKKSAGLISQGQAALPPPLMSCTRPSRIFCQSQNLGDLIAQTDSALRDVEKGCRQAMRAAAKVSKIAVTKGVKVSTVKGAKGALRKKIRQLFNTARGSLFTIPPELHQCS